MAAASKGSSKAKCVVMGLLALWAVISTIVVVVWATSPDLKGSAQCRAELRDATEKMEGAKVVFHKDRVALEELVQEARGEQDRLQGEILTLLGRLNATNTTLEECRQENAVLSENITVLRRDAQQLQRREANLTELLGLQEERAEALQQNLTQASHQTEACQSLKAAADSHMLAAQSQTKSCESHQQYLQKQLSSVTVGQTDGDR